jgi:O-methyltransferase
MIKRTIIAGFRAFGYVPMRIEPPQPIAAGLRDVPEDFTEDETATYRAVEQYTMTTPERIQALVTATRYVVESGLQGAFVECGVWRGGSMMAVARTLLELGAADRDLYLFDTFTGMTEPTPEDVIRASGDAASDLLATHDRDARVWAVSPLEEVKANMGRIRYDQARIHYVEGDVMDTLPECAPESIALLRLDTDWYRSTRHELTHLYPRLVPGGILILDDYGHWGGARKAVDEFVTEQQVTLLLQRIDVTGRITQKPR